MNKFFSKIAIGIASFAMVVGVGVGAAVSDSKEAKAVYADTGTITLVPDNASTGNTATKYVTSHYGFTYEGVAWSFNQWNPSNLQVKTNQSSATSEFNFYTGVFPGNVTSVVITFSALTVTSNTGFKLAHKAAAFTSAQSSGGDTMTWDSSKKTLSWSKSDSTSTAIAFYQNGKVASGTNYLDKIEVTYSTSSSGNDDPIALTNPNPQYNDEDRVITWTKDTNATKYQIKVDSGSYTDIETNTYDARSLTADEEHTVAIKAVGDETKFTSTEGSIKFTPTVYEIHRKFTIASTSSVTERGDAITGATASYFQTYYGNDGVGKAIKDHSMTLTVTGLTKKVSINKLVLSMKSNAKEGSGAVAVIIDGGETKYIAGTSPSDGVGFNAFGDNTSYGNTFRKVTWKDLSFVAKESIEIKIYCSENSLYCEYFNIFFSEEVNNDYVTSLSVTPNTWNGYTTSLLKVEDFKVSATTGDGEGTEADYVCLGIGHMEDGEFVARDDRFFIGYPEVTDTRLYWKAKYPTTPGGSTYLYTYVTLTVSEDTLTGVAFEGKMDKTSYYTTDRWVIYGLTVNAVYESGNTIDVTYRSEITYYSDSAMTNEVATPDALGVGNNQTIYIKAEYQGFKNAVGYAQTVDVSYEHGYLIDDPLTPDEAIAIGSQNGNNGETQKEYYVRGTVISVEKNQLDQEGKNKWATFYLEESSEQFAFEGFQIAPNENCTNYEDLKEGAEVLLRCRLKNYKNIVIENGSVGEIVSITFKNADLTDIILDKTALLMTIGEKYVLNTSALPLGAELGEVTWTSSNEKVATVVDGAVTALTAGSTTITATSKGVKATCEVNVYNNGATMSYSGSENTNMKETGNAKTVGLDEKMFTVDAKQGNASVLPGLNSNGEIRLYKDTKGSDSEGASFTVKIDSKYTIGAINVVFKSGDENATVYVGTKVVTAKDTGVYEINADSFTIKDTGSETIKISSIGIFYRDAVAAEKVERLTTQTSLAYNYDVDGEGNFTYSNIVMRFGAKISKDLWNELDTDKHTITGFGVMIADGDVVANDKDFAEAIEMTTPSTEGKDLSTEVAIDYFVPVANMETTIGVEGDNYFWNLRFSVDAANIDKMYSAIAYVKVGDEYVVLNMARESVVTLAKDYIANRGYDATTAGGSLSNLAK